jgi:hypothetical protein
MEKVDKDKAAKTGDFLYRYMWTRHRCTGAPAPADAAWLAYLIAWGKKKFDNIHVEPEESPPIVWDNHHPAFFSAMVEMNYAATPRPADLAAWRTYVLYNSIPPETPLESPKPGVPIRARSMRSEHDVIAEVWGKQTKLDVTTPWWRWRVHPRIPQPVHGLETERA